MFLQGQITGDLPSVLVEQAETDISSADLFEIKYGSNFKVMLERHAKEMYVLTQCGTIQPNEVQIDAVMMKPSDYTIKHFTVPLQVVGAQTSVVLEFFTALGVEDRVKYVGQYASGACWQKALGCGATADMTAQLPEVDAWFMDCDYTRGCISVNEQAKGVHVSATQDPGPLRSAEHIKFVAAFFNKEELANDLFVAQVASYRGLAASYSTQPTVAWIEYNSWGTAAFKLSQAIYKLRYVQHAGGRNVDGNEVKRLIGSHMEKDTAVSGTTYTLALSGFSGTPAEQKASASAAFFEALKSLDVSVVIDETYASAPRDYTISSFYDTFGLSASSDLRFITGRKVLRVDGTISEGDGLAWFESRIALPDGAAEGLARAVHGDASKQRLYFRNIAENEEPTVISPGQCANIVPACDDTAYPESIGMMVGVEASEASWRCSLGALLLLTVFAVQA